MRTRDAGSIARANELTPDSFQETPRVYLQPTKSDDPQVEFYDKYERETIAYDTEHIKQHGEDLNIILIFVGFYVSIITIQR